MSDEVYKDHETRCLILEYIAKNPGASFVTMKNAFRMSDSTLRYHLDYVQRKKRIALEKEGGKRCYYPYIRKCYPYIIGRIDLNEEQMRILDLVSMCPGITVHDLRVRSGMTNGTFSYNLKRLKDAKLIWRTQNAKGFGYEVITREKIADEVFLILLNRYLEGGIDKREMDEFFDKLEDYRKDR